MDWIIKNKFYDRSGKNTSSRQWDIVVDRIMCVYVMSRVCGQKK